MKSPRADMSRLNNAFINRKMLFTHSRPFRDAVKHTFCKFHTVHSTKLTLHEFIAVKTIRAPHNPETEEPLSGITIADCVK